MSKAPELVVVNAAYNFMPVESLTVVHSSLKVGKGIYTQHYQYF